VSFLFALANAVVRREGYIHFGKEHCGAEEDFGEFSGQKGSEINVYFNSYRSRKKILGSVKAFKLQNCISYVMKNRNLVNSKSK